MRAVLAVASDNTDRALEWIERDATSRLTEEERDASSRVADFNAESTQCPACGATFATEGVTRCPDCDLRFA